MSELASLRMTITERELEECNRHIVTPYLQMLQTAYNDAPDWDRAEYSMDKVLKQVYGDGRLSDRDLRVIEHVYGCLVDANETVILV